MGKTSSAIRRAIKSCFVFYSIFNIFSFQADAQTVQLPMAWCAIEGSPADRAPQIGGDISTDQILWRRHERPTDAYFLPTANVTLRSAILRIGAKFSFPVIDDPSRVSGESGDVLFNDKNERDQLVELCDRAYVDADHTTVGVTAINLNHYTNDNGLLVPKVGEGGCTIWATGPKAGNCVIPYDGFILVTDNKYLHPDSPDRCISQGSPPSCRYFVEDPTDVLVAHEVGHALTLPHVSDDPSNIMYSGPADEVPPFRFNGAQAQIIRKNAINVAGSSSLSTTGVTKIATILSSSKFDGRGDFLSLKPPQDLTSVNVLWVEGSVITDQPSMIYRSNFAGLFSELTSNTKLWFLRDDDGDETTGGNDLQLSEIGMPPTRFSGVELVVSVSIDNLGLLTNANFYTWNGVEFELSSDLPKSYVNLTYVGATPKFSQIFDEQGNPTVTLPVPNLEISSSGVEISVPETEPDRLSDQKIQIIVQDQLRGIVDKLDDNPNELGVTVGLKPPSIPTCKIVDSVGTGVTAEFYNLLPSEPVHALLGFTKVADGMANATGGGTVSFEIPSGTTFGPKLVTIGTDGTALTADCVVNHG